MSASEHSEHQASHEAILPGEQDPLPGVGNTLAGNRYTPQATPPGDDNTALQYEPERRVSQGGKTDNPNVAEILAETNTLEETTYPDMTGTIQDTEWIGQGGELDNTVNESRVGLDRPSLA